MKPQIPWLRVIVEGVVIVGSILLAFGIDAAWEGRQERARKTSHLEALADEIADARSALLASQGRRELRTESIRSLLGAIRNRGSVPPDSIIQDWIGTLWGASAPMRHLAALDDLREGGTLILIESDSLRRALFGYERQVERLRGVEERVIRAWEEELRPYMVVHTDALPQLQASGRVPHLADYEPAFDSGLAALLQDRTFQNLLLVRWNRTDTAYNYASEVLDHLDEIARLVDVELR